MVFTGRLNYPVLNRKSKIHGTGAFAKEFIPPRKKIGSLSGSIISKAEARRKSRNHKCVAIVELWNGKAIDCSANSNELRYINHSCEPNTFMRTINYHVEFYSLKSIQPDDELTCNYGVTHHEGKRKCSCGAAKCKGCI
ncbi:MAG TPA: SET domain-containing protein-lysine N-methyltransferase [Flavisolibacter sp.]|nr:SET domain-containing protein-lysine N-methyltransferase [Flavisolibacter sp.]